MFCIQYPSSSLIFDPVLSFLLFPDPNNTTKISSNVMINKSLLGGKWKHTPIGCGIKMKDSPSNGCKERNFLTLI